MTDPIKRVHYFDHQFLRVEDFACEQDYHVARRRLHNRLLHTPGIAQGLEVEYKQGASEVTIGPGTAVDSEGCEIVLTEDQHHPLPDWKESQEYWLTIAYHEHTTDSTQETGVEGDTRWEETPVIEWSKDPEQEVVLAHLCRSDDKVTVDSSENVRTVAGAKLGDTTARKLTLACDGVDSSQWPALSCGAANRVDLAGDLKVTGNVGIGTDPPPGSSLTINAAPKDRPRIVFQQGGKDSWDIGVEEGGYLFFGDLARQQYRMRLYSNGDIKVGPAPGLYVLGGVENLNLIRGTVAPGGSILEGQGFTIQRTGPGLYNILFNSAFPAKPTVIATQQWPDRDDFNEAGGDTRDNCVVVAVSNTHCRIKCGSGEGVPVDRRFHFIAIGPR